MPEKSDGPPPTPGTSAEPASNQDGASNGHESFRTADATGKPRLDAALALAERGGPVFPLHTLTSEGSCTCRRPDCSSPGKHPRTRNGVKDATVDRAQIIQWWTEMPEANVGFATGAASGIVVLDVDPKHGGLVSLEEMEAANDALPPTRSVLTGRDGTGTRGRHYYFRAPEGIVVKNSVGAHGIAPGLDIRGEGGYVVVPPSSHKSGVSYEWGASRPTLADMPAWLLALATGKHGAISSTSTPPLDIGEDTPIPEGARNDTLFRIACGLRRKGHSSEEIFALLQKVNERRCAPNSLEPGEVQGIVRQASNYAPTEPLVGKPGVSRDEGKFFQRGPRTYWRKETQHGTKEEVIAHCAPYITQDLVMDDGAEVVGYFVIEGTSRDGSPLPVAKITRAKFGHMEWPEEQWGTKGIVCSGHRDRFREAIQILSGNPTHRTIYGHTGWREVGGEYIYLFHGGAIGPRGPCGDVEVELETRDGKLTNFKLPKPPEPHSIAMREHARGALSFLDAASDNVTVPLLAGIPRAILCDFLPADLALYLVGKTGSYKSALVAVQQAFFGPGFSRTNLPESWQSTANRIERTAFITKDTICVVDDFVPGQSQGQTHKNHEKAEQVFRGIGNRSGRGRLNAESGFRATYYPRGLIVSTGEDTPRGESIRARLLILEVLKSDVRLDVLTRLQKHAADGTLAATTAALAQWIAQRYDELRTDFPARVAALREEFRRDGMHARTPEAIAGLGAAWELYLRFFVDVGAIAPEEREHIWQRVQHALRNLGLTQARHIEAQNTSLRFFDYIGTLIRSGKAHLTTPDGGRPSESGKYGWKRGVYMGAHDAHEQWEPQGVRIGWVPDAEPGTLWLDPGTAYAEAIQLQSKRGEGGLPNETTLWKDLKAAKLLAGTDSRGDRNVVRRAVEKSRIPVLHVYERHVLRGVHRDDAELGVFDLASDDAEDAARLVQLIGEGKDRQSLLDEAEREGIDADRASGILRHLEARGRIRLHGRTYAREGASA